MKYFIVFCVIINAVFFKAQTIDANGKKQGYWKKKDEKGMHMIYEGEFKDDKPVGKFKYYYPHDTVRAIMYFRQDGKTSNAKLFHLNGKRMAQGNYINKETKDSTWNYFDEDGKLISTENYKAGKKQGLCLVYLPDGKLSEELNFKDGLQHGPFKKYFDGVNLRSKGQCINGAMDGKILHYYPNGVEAASGYYLKGNKNGVWVYKNEDGKIKEKELYKNGKLASKKETDAFFQKSKPESPNQNTITPKASNTGTLYNVHPKEKK